MDASSKHRANTNAVSRPVAARGEQVEADPVSHVQSTANGAHGASLGLGESPLIRPPGRPRGIPKTGGRQKGTKNHRTVEIEKVMSSLVPAVKRRIKKLIQSDDEKVAFSACMGVLAYKYGRPIDRQQVGGIPDGAPVTLASGLSESKLELARRISLILDLGVKERDELVAADPKISKLAGADAREGAALSPDAAAPASAFSSKWQAPSPDESGPPFDYVLVQDDAGHIAIIKAGDTIGSYSTRKSAVAASWAHARGEPMPVDDAPESEDGELRPPAKGQSLYFGANGFGGLRITCTGPQRPGLVDTYAVKRESGEQLASGNFERCLDLVRKQNGGELPKPERRAEASRGMPEPPRPDELGLPVQRRPEVHRRRPR